MQRVRKLAPRFFQHACGLQAEVEASWAGRRQAALLGRQDEEKRAVEAAGRLQVARERAKQRERLRVQQNAALQACICLLCAVQEGLSKYPQDRVCTGKDSLLHSVLMCPGSAAAKHVHMQATHATQCEMAIMQAAAAKEAERMRAEAEAKRRAFEADEAALAAELQQRTEAEWRILEQAAERARAALEQRRRRGCFSERMNIKK